MLRSNPYKVWNILAFAVMIAINAMANTSLLGGKTTGDISDMFTTLLTPADYAFTIWLLIYVLLLGFVLYQSNRMTETRDSVHYIGPWFLISCLLNVLWVLMWQYLYIGLAALMLILLLLSLLMIYLRTRRIHYPTLGEMWWVKLPFSLYLGWVIAAAVSNLSILLNQHGFTGWGLGRENLSVALMLIGALLSLLISFPYRDSILPLGPVWAFIAIAVKHNHSDEVFVAALLLAAILFIYAIYLFFARNRDRD